MNTLTFTFDTLKYSKRLRDAGMEPKLAEAEAEILNETLSAALGTADLATKGDLREIEARIEAKIEASTANIIKWLAGLMIAQGAAIAAMVKML